MENLLTPADAARILGITPATIRLMVATGKLKVAVRTEGGIRLFRRADIERLATQRAEQAKARAVAAGGSR